MGSRFRRSRRAPGDIQQELRAAKPEPRQDFVAELTGTMHRGSRFRWARPAAALVILCAGLAALGAFGGLGYAANALSKTAGSASETLSLSSKAPKVDSNSPARDQYGGPGGCTPGYWKQSQHFFRWGSVPQSQSFNATFGVTAAQSGFSNSFSLLQALANGGGGMNALGRHAAAAYLNSRTLGMNFPYATAQVIAMVKAAILSGNAKTIEDTKNTLAKANELEGPLC